MQRGCNGILICHWNGRFGNRLHQYAYASEYARRFDLPFLLPSEWEGCRLFAEQPHTVVPDDTLRLHLNQSHPSLDTLPARAAAIARYNDATGARFEYLNPDAPEQVWCGKPAVFIDSVCAYHPAIFNGMSAARLKDRFRFSEEVRRTDMFRRLEDQQGTYDIAHLRRDDVSNPDINRIPFDRKLARTFDKGEPLLDETYPTIQRYQDIAGRIRTLLDYKRVLAEKL